MPGPTPITGLPSQRYIARPEAPPEAIHGGPSDPLHGHFGEQAQPYPWQEFAGPRGPYNPVDDLMLSDPPENETFAAGEITQDPSGDYAPYRTHAGPKIRGMQMDPGPEGNAEVLRQSAEAHSVKTNSAAKGVASSNPLEDQWEHFYSVVPGEDIQPSVPGSVSFQANGFGVNDHTSNPFAKRNPNGLDSSHRMRRYAVGHIPGNFMWMKPAGRPLHKTLAGPAKLPVGEGPFAGSDTTIAFSSYGAVLEGPATEYVAPPQPYVIPAVQGQETPSDIPLW